MNEPAINVVPWKAPSPAENLLSVLTDAIRSKSIDIDLARELSTLYRDLNTQAAEEAFDAAMNEAQAEMTRVATDSKNHQTHSKYVSYAALDRAVRPIYTRHGFSLTFDTGESEPSSVLVKCRVSRGSYHRTYSILMPADGKGPKGNDVMTKTHAAGSAVTYGRRYLLGMIFNIAVGQDDDDGNGAAGKGSPPSCCRRTR